MEQKSSNISWTLYPCNHFQPGLTFVNKTEATFLEITIINFSQIRRGQTLFPSKKHIIKFDQGRIMNKLMYICAYVCAYVCMYVCMYICAHVCMYICVYVCMYVCMYACIQNKL